MLAKMIGLFISLSTLSLFAEESLVAEIKPASALGNVAQKGETPKSTPKECMIEYPHRFQVGGTYSYAWITPSGNSTTKGNLGGIQAIYEYRPLGCVYAGTAFNWRDGKTKNSGSSRTLEDFNVQERLGYTLPYRTTCLRTTLFTGIGARYMAEDVKVGDSTITFDYTQFYVPLGILLEKQVARMLSIGLNFQWMPQIFPIVRIQPLSGAWWDLTYQLPNFAVDIPFKFTPSKNRRFDLIIDPFFEYWRDGRTTATTDRGLTLNLPGNKYLFLGVNVNLAFSF